MTASIAALFVLLYD